MIMQYMSNFHFEIKLSTFTFYFWKIFLLNHRFKYKYWSDDSDQISKLKYTRNLRKFFISLNLSSSDFPVIFHCPSSPQFLCFKSHSRTQANMIITYKWPLIIPFAITIEWLNPKGNFTFLPAGKNYFSYRYHRYATLSVTNNSIKRKCRPSMPTASIFVHF